MENKYAELENRFDCACKEVVEKLSETYKSDYKAQGPEKLTAFLDLIQRKFDDAETLFIKENKLAADADALHAIKAIAKTYARKCIDDYGRVS